MPGHGVDRNLLFGILALQNNFIDRETLLAAFQSWVVDKSRDLGAILVEQGRLAGGRAALLDALVVEHLRQHGDDPRRSLGSLSSLGPAREILDSLPDADLKESLGRALSAQGARDPYATIQGVSLGPPASNNGRFRILSFHDKGGLGQVSLAQDVELGRQVALKEIQERYADDPESRSRFVQEAELTGKLEHPGIVPVYGLGHDLIGRPYYAMRFIKGSSLLEAIKRFHGEAGPGADRGRHAVELRDLIGRFLDVCDAIAYAHSRGVLHRDLKPGNVMLGPFGETLVVDWGLAKPVGQSDDPAVEPIRPSSDEGSGHETRGVVGTPAYMSPEQAEGRHDLLGTASDVYSLGATLYHLLTGRAPFSEVDGPVLPRVIRGEFRPPRQVRPEVARPLDAICSKAMALSRADRYASPRALSDDVRRWLAHEPVLAWPEPWTIRLGRLIARHRTEVASGAAALLVAMVAAAIALAQARVRDAKEGARAEALLKTLVTAETMYVPQIVEDLAPYRERVELPLRALHRDAAATPHGKLHAALALLPDDPSLGESLYEPLLTADPEALIVIREALKPGHAKELAPRLWQVLGDEKAASDRRLRAAGALASYDPADRRWAGVAGLVVGWLVVENPLLVKDWVRAMEPIQGLLREPLAGIVRLRDHDRGRSSTEVALSRQILGNYLPDDPESLAGLILDLDTADFNRLIGRLEKVESRGRAIAALTRISQDQATGDLMARDVQARRRARALIALARLGEPGPLLEALASSPDPASKAYLLADLAPLKVARDPLVERLNREADPSALKGLMLGLGELAEGPGGDRQSLVARLSSFYRESPDPGLHSASEWALRALGAGDAVRSIEAELAARPTPPGRDWYVNKQGQTLAILGPRDFEMGSPPDEPDRAPLGDETRHRRRIARRFAVATKEVTLEQFRRFLPAFEKYDEYGPHDDGPVLAVSWVDAALYCRWLSEQEGLPEDQICYQVAADPKDGVVVAPNALERSGYRLPTEAEWECACRAGTTTGRPCGDSAVLLTRYAWCHPTAQKVAHPVGTLLPNDWGLFDMLGNADEWCHDPEGDYPKSVDGRPLEAEATLADLARSGNRIQRGGSFRYEAASIRSAQREWYDQRDRNTVFGFRVARTMPGADLRP